MLEDLNPEQRKAATALSGRVLVTAGAGSGKTRMLVSRFIHAVSADPPVPMSGIVAITFTEKAAGELSERIRAELRGCGSAASEDVDTAWISTIHGLCARILRENALEIGIDPSFRVLEGPESKAIYDRALEEALTDALERSEWSRRLLGAFGYEEVVGATAALSAALRSRGLDCDRCTVASPTSLEAVLASGRRELADIGAAFSGSDAEDAVIQAWLGQVRAADEALALLEGDHEDSHEEIALALRALCAKPPKLSKVGLSVVCRELSSVRSRLCSELAAIWAAPLAVEIIEITRDTMRRAEAGPEQADALDFDDLQIRVTELLRDRPDIAEGYRSEFQLLMIDEFQDTDALQLEIVEALAGLGLCTVGDANQSIYRFRGADLRVYQAHVDDMRRCVATEAELCENYRSHADILRFVNAFFGAEELFGDRLVPLVASRDDTEAWASTFGLPVRPRIEALVVAKQQSKEDPSRFAAAQAVAGRLKELHDAGIPESDMVVLLRTLRHADKYLAELERAGLAAVIHGGSRFFELPETGLMEALVRVLANPHDEEALAVVLASDLGDVSDDALLQLRGVKGMRLWTALGRCGEALTGPDLDRAIRVHAVLARALGRVGDASLSTILLEAIEGLGYDLVLLGRGDSGAEAFANVLKFLRLAERFEASGGIGPLRYAQHLRVQRELKEPEAPATVFDDRTPAVRIMTIHGSKGLEFPVVVVPELAELLSRSDRARIRTGIDEQGDVEVALAVPRECTGGSKPVSTPEFERLNEASKRADKEEGKRLLYVAFTRAREILILAGASSAKPTSGLSESGVTWLRDTVGLSGPLEPLDEMSRASTGAGEPVTVHVRVLEEREPLRLEARPASVRSRQCEVPDLPHVEARPLPGPNQLSFSQIATYRACPRRFFAERVLGLRAPDDPTAENARTFGSALHACMESADESGCVSDERLEAIVLRFGLEGDAVERLRRATANLGSCEAVRRALGDPTTGREVPFAFGLAADAAGNRDFTLAGYIDLYRRDGEQAFIVDYKSGQGAHRDEPGSVYEMQAECYALAAMSAGASHVHVAFVFPEADGPDGRVPSVEFEFDENDQARIERDLSEIAGPIVSEEWEPPPHPDRLACRDCPVFPDLCGVRAEGD